MLHKIKLGGKTRNLLFGNYVFKKLKDEQGITLLDISQFFSDAVKASAAASEGADLVSGPDFTILYPMVYHALRAGEIYANDPEPDVYDVDKVCVWMDMEPGSMMKVIPLISESLTSLSAGAPVADGEAAKKKKRI